MKVAFVAPVWPPELTANGIVTYIRRVREGLDGFGVESRVLAATVLGGTPDSDIVDLDQHRAGRLAERIASRLHPRDFDGYWIARGILGGLRHLRKNFVPDILEMEESFGSCENVAKRTRSPVVTRLHGPWFLNGAALGAPYDEAFRRRVAMEGRAIANAAAITSPSQGLLDQVRREYALELPRAEVIPNPAPVVDADRRWRLDTCDPNLILFVGRFDRHKGGDLVVDAFSLVASRRPDLKLVFVGPDRGFDDGRGASVGLEEYLSKHVPDLSVRSRIETVGQLAYPEIESLRPQARITIVASRFEVFGMVVVEALAFGCPVVAARTGGISEIVSHEESGLLFAPGDAADLAHQLEVALDQPDRSAAMGARGAADMNSRFGPAAVAERTKQYYQTVLDRARR